MCKKILLVALVLCLASSASAVMVAEWKMDEGTGTSAADTLGGSALTWSATNPGITWNGSGGVQSPTDALSFDGTTYPNTNTDGTYYPSLPAYYDDGAATDDRTSGHLEFGMGSFTISLEFKTETIGSQQATLGGTLFMKGHNSHRYSVQWHGGGLGMEYDSMSDFASDGTTPVPNNGKSQFYVNADAYADGQWHHLTATVDRDELDFGGTGMSPYGTLRMRIDGAIHGEMAAVSDMTFDEPRTQFCVGYNDWVNGYEFTGQIDHVKAYNHAVIPEPATMSLLALGGLALLRKRR